MRSIWGAGQEDQSEEATHGLKQTAEGPLALSLHPNTLAGGCVVTNADGSAPSPLALSVGTATVDLGENCLAGCATCTDEKAQMSLDRQEAGGHD